MREIHINEVIENVAKLCIEANVNLPEDIENAFKQGRETEKSPLGCTVFDKMIDNCILAREKRVPICQDTGMAMVFVEIGQDVHIVGGLLEDAINEGVRRGYVDGYLRCSVVSDPLERANTDDNTPAIIYTNFIAGDKMHITVAPKGFGSENMSSLKMFNPSATEQDIVDFIVSACKNAGSNPCPPIIIGVGIGGTSDKCLYLAKKALLRPVGQKSASPRYEKLEKEILDKVNNLGIGPQGFGGTVTALTCAIETFATHIAGLPVAVNIGCHVTRHAEITL